MAEGLQRALVGAGGLLTGLAVGGVLYALTSHPSYGTGPRWGWVDRDGAFVIPARFDHARRFVGGRAAAADAGRWGHVDRSGAFVLGPSWSELCDPTDQLVCARDPASGKWGWLAADGSWAVPPRYDRVVPMADGVAAVGVVVAELPRPLELEGTVQVVHWGLMGADGTEIVAPAAPEDPEAWTGVGPFGEGWMPVRRGGRWGYVDRTGAWTLPPTWRAAKPFRNGFAGVAEGQWSVIDRSGQVVVTPAHGLADGMADGRIAGGSGYHALDGTPVGPRWDWVRPPVAGIGVAMRAGAWTAVGLDGEARFPPTFGRLTDYTDGRALAASLVGDAFAWGIVDLEGTWVAEPRWIAVDETGFHEGLAAVAVSSEITPPDGPGGASSAR